MTEQAKTDTTAPAPAANDLDGVLARIDALVTEKTNAPVEQVFTEEQFKAYATEQLEKARGEELEPATARLTALKSATDLAKQFFGRGEPAKLPIYTDKWQLKPEPPKTIATPPPGQTTGMTFKSETPARQIAFGLAALAKQLKDETSDVAVALKKSERMTVSKAGEAAAMLEKIGQMFGVDMTEDKYDIRWKVGDAICALAEAAKLEQVMTTLQQTLGGASAPAAAPAPAPEPAPKAAEAPADDKVAKAANAWPMDMNGTSYDSRTGTHKSDKNAWGREE